MTKGQSHANDQKRQQNNESNEENLRSEEGEGSLLRLVTEGNNIRSGEEQKEPEAQEPVIVQKTVNISQDVRRITHLYKRLQPNSPVRMPPSVGEWYQEISLDQAFKEFSERFRQVTGTNITREKFESEFMLIRYIEVTQ